MFRKIKCPRCGNEIDENKFECDFCGRQEPKNEKFKFISMLPSWKQLLLFAIGFIGFQLFAYFISFIVIQIANVQLGIGTFEYYAFVNSYKYVGYVNFTSYLLIFTALGVLVIKDANELLRTFKKLKPLIAGIIGLFVILIFNSLYTTILKFAGITLSINANENTIDNIVVQYPVFSIIIFGLIGPIVEEITYRVGVFSFFSRVNKILAYVLTVIIFALIHFEFTSTTIINELLNIPLYLSAAFVLCYLYDHYGFAGSVYCHILNNILSIISTIAVTK